MNDQTILSDWDEAWRNQFEWRSEKQPSLTCGGLYCASGECVPKVEVDFCNAIFVDFGEYAHTVIVSGACL